MRNTRCWSAVPIKQSHLTKPEKRSEVIAHFYMSDWNTEKRPSLPPACLKNKQTRKIRIKGMSKRGREAERKRRQNESKTHYRAAVEGQPRILRQ